MLEIVKKVVEVLAEEFDVDDIYVDCYEETIELSEAQKILDDAIVETASLKEKLRGATRRLEELQVERDILVRRAETARRILASEEMVVVGIEA